jgi:hypothetical protein
MIWYPDADTELVYRKLYTIFYWRLLVTVYIQFKHASVIQFLKYAVYVLF